MQTMKKLLLFFFLAGMQLQAQIDSTRREFYPLHLGDLWQYRDEYGRISRTWQIIRVDSLMPNGERYAVFGAPPLFNTGYVFMRIDTLLRVQHYGGWGGDTCGGTTPNDISIYRLGETPGTIWRDCLNFGGYLTRRTIVKFNGISQIIAFGRWRDAMLFRFGGVFPPPVDTMYGSWGILVRGIGLYREEYYERMGFNQLTGAIINGVTYGTVVGVDGIPGSIPTEVKLYQNFPNPFNSSTTIRYELPEATHVRLSLYDILGREVSTLVNAFQQAGSYELSVESEPLSSGMYFCRLVVGDRMLTNKMIIQK